MALCLCVCVSVCLSVRHKPIMLSLLQRNGKMIQLDIWHIRLHPPQGQTGGSVAEWLACWTQAQNSPGSNRSRGDVG